MKSAWNLVGMGLWLLLVIYLVWMVHDMRVRRLKLLVTEKRSWSWQNITKSSIELVIFLLAFWGMSYTTLFQDVNAVNSKRVTVAYQYKPLVLDTSSVGSSAYVTIKNGNGTKPVQYYTFYTAGEKDMVSSENATVSSGTHPINVVASAYTWNQSKVKQMEKQHQKAWIGVEETTYKKTFLNGIGLHAGRLANRFTLIRVPDHSFIKQANQSNQQ
ncbi:LVIS_2131 family protein [Secundilactobacillus odoratitofui]|nr:LVIS_2131 family protein [Secundilactobacillus odoratitofui]